jgi:hypothetical protein
MHTDFILERSGAGLQIPPFYKHIYLPLMLWEYIEHLTGPEDKAGNDLDR